MAALRALCILVTLAGFFLIGTPLQWVIGRIAPAAAHRIPKLFSASLLRLLRIRLAVEGSWAPRGPTLVVANHVSWIDILALVSVEPFCFLAKSEVARWPILSAFAEVQGTVFVDRRRRRSIPPANREMARRMLAGRSVLLFPEGTTIDASEPGRFRSSHFATARDLLRASPIHESVTVQPVAIAYSSPKAAWVGDDDLIPHVWRVLRGKPIECRMTFTTPIAYDATSDRKTVAKRSRDAIADAIRRRHRIEESESTMPEIGLVRAQPSGC